MADQTDATSGDETQADNSQNEDTTTTAGATLEDKGAQPLVFDTWQGEQSEEIQTMLGDRFSKLENALNAERGSVKELRGELKTLAKNADDATKTALAEMDTRLETAEQKADFFDDLSAAGCANLKLAWFAANQDKFFDRRGNVKMDDLKQAHPQLFTQKKTPTPDYKAGQGNGQQISGGKPNFDAMIREKAKR